MTKKQRRPYRSQPSRPRTVQFEIIEQKANPAFMGIFDYGGNPQPHTMPKNYSSYAKEGYRGNDVIFKVINYIITNGAAIPPVLFTSQAEALKPNGKRIDNHPLLDKLARPNIEQSGVAYRKAVLGYFLVAGNSYQYAIRKGIAGPPDELWTLQPDKVKINPTKTRGVVSYMFDDFDGTFDNPVAGQNPIPAANMAHWKTWSPDDPLFGVSPIEVGAIKVDQQAAAQKWNLGLLQNGGKLSGAFTTPIILAPNDRKKTEDRLNEKISGPQNAGKFAVLDGGLTWNQMGMPPAQMDWLPGIQYNGGQLANLYNMPPQLTGDTSSTTYDNMEQAKAASYTEEIFPVLDDLYALWRMWLVPMYPDLCDSTGKSVAYLYYDKETVEVVQNVIQQQKTAKATRANQSWMQGTAMLDEAREAQGLPPLPNGMGKVFRFGAVLVRAAKLDEYAEQSLQKPAAPPMPVPEPELNVPPGGNDDPSAPQPVPSTSGNPDASDPVHSTAGKSPGKASLSLALRPQTGTPGTSTSQKDLDAQGVYQPDDLEARLAAYSLQGVTHLMAVSDGNPCEKICKQNDGVTVELGKPFPSGHILEPFHNRCECKTVPITNTAKAVDRKQARQDYKQFIEEVVLA